MVVLVSLLLVAPRPSMAAERSAWGEAGIGVLSVLSSFIYGPVKVLYAAAGTLTAGLAFALTGGQRDLAQVLIARSLRGDYLVTDEHLTGQRPLIFVGRDPAIDPSPSDFPSESESTEPYPY